MLSRGLIKYDGRLERREREREREIERVSVCVCVCACVCQGKLCCQDDDEVVSFGTLCGIEQ